MTVHDEAMATRIRDSLAGDKRISNLPIDVRVSGDEVYMKGSVDSFEQVDVIQFIVSGLPGVRHVNVDEIEVREAGR